MNKVHAFKPYFFKLYHDVFSLHVPGIQYCTPLCVCKSQEIQFATHLFSIMLSIVTISAYSGRLTQQLFNNIMQQRTMSGLIYCDYTISVHVSILKNYNKIKCLWLKIWEQQKEDNIWRFYPYILIIQIQLMYQKFTEVNISVSPTISANCSGRYNS